MRSKTGRDFFSGLVFGSFDIGLVGIESSSATSNS